MAHSTRKDACYTNLVTDDNKKNFKTVSSTINESQTSLSKDGKVNATVASGFEMNTDEYQIKNSTSHHLLPNQSESDNKINKEDLREEILSHVSNCSGETFFRSQQRDEPELSSVEKKEIAASLLDSSPSNFLARFGKVLDPSHLFYFHQYKDSYEVMFYLQQLENRATVSKVSVKNRRFHAMNEMIKQGEYFSMKEMRKRNPTLFHQLVEKYMSMEEKRMLEQEEPKICNLSTIFMAHIDGDENSSKRKNEQKADQFAWDQASSSEEEEYDTEDDDAGQEEKRFFRDEFISST